jgi:DNA-binding transcriptional MerR regulator
VTPKLYKAADVCEIAGLQPYVLRSWEKEFPGIGVQKSPESTRLYRQADVDQVLRIKQLVFGEGLTLAGARRRLESAPAQPSKSGGGVEMAEVLDTLGADARARIAHVRSGLRSILDVLSKTPGASPAATATDGDSGPSVTDRRSGPSAPAERPPRSVAARGKSSAAAKRTVTAKRGAVTRKGDGAKRKRVTQQY